MNKLLGTIAICLLCLDSTGQETDTIRNSLFFHGGFGIPLLISTSDKKNSELFKMDEKSLWNVGQGIYYSRKFTRDLSCTFYMEYRVFDFDFDELVKLIQSQIVGYSAMPYFGGDMFFSYGNAFIGLKYGKSVNRLCMDLLILSGPTLYLLAEPTVHFKEIGGNNILTFNYKDGTGVGLSINPQLHVGYQIIKRFYLTIRCSYLSSYAKIKYQKIKSDLIDFQYSENIESKQRMNTIITGIGFKIEF